MRPDLSIGVIDKESTAGVSVAYCPERVLPSRILTELVNNDRCIGGDHRVLREASSAILQDLCPWSLRSNDGAHSRVGEADRKCVSRYKHRICQ